MIRVVLDTNIVVSALLRSDGLPAAVFSLAVDQVVQLCISEQIMNEYEEVLRRPRLKTNARKVTTALVSIRETGLLVTPSATVTAASDPDDNIFLECAVAARGLPRKPFWEVRIVTARQFLGDIIDLQRSPAPHT